MSANISFRSERNPGGMMKRRRIRIPKIKGALSTRYTEQVEGSLAGECQALV